MRLFLFYFVIFHGVPWPNFLSFVNIFDNNMQLFVFLFSLLSISFCFQALIIVNKKICKKSNSLFSSLSADDDAIVCYFFFNYFIILTVITN